VVEKAGSRPRILTNFRTGVPSGRMLDFFKKTWLFPIDLDHFAHSPSTVVGGDVNISRESGSEIQLSRTTRLVAG